MSDNVPLDESSRSSFELAPFRSSGFTQFDESLETDAAASAAGDDVNEVDGAAAFGDDDFVDLDGL